MQSFNRIILLTLTTFLLLVYPAPGDNHSPTPPSRKALQITVASYNMHSGLTASGTPDLERVAAVIRASGADIIALQEVDLKTDRSGRVDQAAVLAELLGMDYVFGTAKRWMDGGSLGNAVLSRFEPINHRNRRLPGSIFRVPRKALEVTIRLPESRGELLFISTHFALDSGDRIRSAEWLNRTYRNHAGPVVLAGDLNSRPGSQVLEILGTGWQITTPEGSGLTYPAGSPEVRIDYLMTLRDRSMRAERVRTAQSSVSDHRLIYTKLRLE